MGKNHGDLIGTETGGDLHILRIFWLVVTGTWMDYDFPIILGME